MQNFLIMSGKKLKTSLRNFLFFKLILELKTRLTCLTPWETWALTRPGLLALRGAIMLAPVPPVMVGTATAFCKYLLMMARWLQYFLRGDHGVYLYYYPSLTVKTVGFKYVGFCPRKAGGVEKIRREGFWYRAETVVWILTHIGGDHTVASFSLKWK